MGLVSPIGGALMSPRALGVLLPLLLTALPGITAAQPMPAGGEFRVNTYTTDRQSGPVVAMDSAGSFVVLWSSKTQDGSLFGVFGQRYDAMGVPRGDEFRVNTYTTNSQLVPAVAVDGAGNFVVVWDSFAQDGSSYGVFGRRYDAAGAQRGASSGSTATRRITRPPALPPSPPPPTAASS
jgi:hypothetical protein